MILNIFNIVKLLKAGDSIWKPAKFWSSLIKFLFKFLWFLCDEFLECYKSLISLITNGTYKQTGDQDDAALLTEELVANLRYSYS